MFPAVEDLMKTLLLAQCLRKFNYPPRYTNLGMLTVSLDAIISSNCGPKR